ncbi:hypothetical protein PPTG_24525 [Phytophthora nicotianae INRA-310]|uniref:Uncharacterized protein n=1 Tax=Phytophthora nicotianae (strain INRA-310) TaxID=761204 RepID=W2PFC4_PHYN3|nr:hypothetical protein PPTG_24525 [Phytophthora nicotianae INRA-310]ETM98908.1 hypothetical protein PPTG_24525 [Phytophthora nicotianae INRA-310]
MTTKDKEYVDGESAVETPMNNATDEERSEVSQNAMVTEEMPRKVGRLHDGGSQHGKVQAKC